MRLYILFIMSFYLIGLSISKAQCQPQSPSDDCSSAPQILTTGTYCGNTSAYTADSPNWLDQKGSNIFGNVTIENSAFYKFVAANTSVAFTVCCGNGCTQKNSFIGASGIQVLIFSGNCGSTSAPYTEKFFIKQLSGADCSACGNSKSYNRSGSGATQLASGKTCLSQTIPNLVIGTTYYLVIDGFEGDDCPFTLQFGNGISLLPTEIVSFEATCLNNNIKLNWVTSSEINCQQFEIQRSDDGINYSSIAILPGHYQSSQMQSYSYSDNQATSNDIVYYRLKQVDLDGTPHYFNKIISSQTSCSQNGTTPKIYPNPANQNVTIHTGSDMLASVEIINELGQVVYQNNCHQQVVVDLHNLAAGVYTVRVNNSRQPYIQKLVVSH